MAKDGGGDTKSAPAREQHPVLMHCTAPALRLAALIAGLSLAACATQPRMVTDSPGLQSSASATAMPPPAQVEPAPAPAPVAAPVAAPAPAGRAARAATPPPPPPPADDQPMTVIKAREQCWMAAESLKSRDVDTRVKYVEQCVRDKMK